MRLDGASILRIIVRYLLPSCMGFIIARAILGKTALGANDPDPQPLALSPWLLPPTLLVVASIPAFNFVVGGLRDTAAPQAHAWLGQGTRRTGLDNPFAIPALTAIRPKFPLGRMPP